MPFFSYLLYAKMPQNTFALISCSGLPQSRAASIRPAPAAAVNAICCGLCHVKDRYFFVMALILLLDSSSPATMLYTPCLEHMTVAIKEPTVTKPKYRLVYVWHFSRGPPDSKLDFQAKWPVVFVSGLKRGGYKTPGTDKVLFWPPLTFS